VGIRKEGIVKSDNSPPQIRNPEISNWTRIGAEPSRQFNLRFRDFGLEVDYCPISDSSGGGYISFLVPSAMRKLEFSK
jgi:hypothetical protein